MFTLEKILHSSVPAITIASALVFFSIVFIELAVSTAAATDGIFKTTKLIATQSPSAPCNSMASHDSGGFQPTETSGSVGTSNARSLFKCNTVNENSLAFLPFNNRYTIDNMGRFPCGTW